MNRQSQIVNLQFVIAAGAVSAGAFWWMADRGVTLGAPAFYGAMALAALAYAAALMAVPRTRVTGTALVAVALLTVAMRAPLAQLPEGPGSDIFRYVWDARAQRAGLSPYYTVPSDPALDALHTAETRDMNNVNIPSPYPPGAQVFFRLATVFDESARAVKLALVACDLATAVLIGWWLRSTGRHPLLLIAYAWNPLVVLEIAGKGHLDAAGMLLTAAAAFALVRGRLAVSVLALAGGIAVKFLPIVLLPLWWGRARLRHALLGIGFLAALYLFYTDIANQIFPVGSVTNMVQGFRFNGPFFKAIAFVTSPWLAAAIGVGAGMACAVLMRRSRAADDPAAFAWPMAAALVFAPVVYPWYLLWLTPFFVSRLTWPLVLWSLLILSVYTVWYGVLNGGTWALPWWLGLIEYGALFGATWWLWSRDGEARRALQLY
jgi:alpha-1,6-mannosyltransferase